MSLESLDICLERRFLGQPINLRPMQWIFLAVSTAMANYDRCYYHLASDSVCNLAWFFRFSEYWNFYIQKFRVGIQSVSGWRNLRGIQSLKRKMLLIWCKKERRHFLSDRTIYYYLKFKAGMKNGHFLPYRPAAQSLSRTPYPVEYF